jgi:sterol desaturase/sphingolipid hydroxylase (fatty acid hydroxylase superfamily)
METILSLLIPVVFVLALVVERLFPARTLPPVKRWLAKGFFFFVLTGVLNGLIPAVFAETLGPHAPFSLAGLGTVLGALVAFAIADLCNYWVHRGLHNVHFLWRWTHQMHHSAERMDIAGAVYFHPFDIALQITSTTVPVVLLGVSPDAAALAGFISFFYAMFQHLNVRTPRWIGWIIQRPEAHSVHHARGVHAYNYGNLPLWDVLFGTFRNPTDYVATQGFWDGASAKIGKMLVGRDVGEPAPGE